MNVLSKVIWKLNQMKEQNTLRDIPETSGEHYSDGVYDACTVILNLIEENS